ncbi:MAG: hypothetical protein JXR73_06610 [Candidatus Omnitrophica bacterium]|nr:hypothetical protein [Candidatus Omnitrophota bacterium]
MNIFRYFMSFIKNRCRWVAGRFASIALLSIVSVMPAFPRPVLLELFTGGGADSQNAEKAAAQLLLEFPSKDLHVVIYPVLEFTLRAFQRGVKTERLPVAVFNGNSRIEGAAQDPYHAYRDQIEQKRINPIQGDMQGWMQLNDGFLVASAAYQLLDDAPEHEKSLYFAVVENRTSDEPGAARNLTLVEHPPARSSRAAVQLDRFFIVDEVKADVVWWIEDDVTKEVLHSCLSRNIAPFQFDANGDGEWDKWDVFALPFLWHSNSTAADRSGDGWIDSFDLLDYLCPDSP